MEKVPDPATEFYKFCRTKAMAGQPDSGAFAIALAIQQVADAIETGLSQVAGIAGSISDERGLREENCSTLIRIQEDIKSFVRMYGENTDPDKA